MYMYGFNRHICYNSRQYLQKINFTIKQLLFSNFVGMSYENESAI